MSKKRIWSLAALLTFGVVLVVQAASLNSLYLPLAYNGKLIPTATPTPTPTPTPKPSDCINPHFPVDTIEVCFTDLDQKPTTGGPINEWVTIKNIGTTAVDMEGWRIASDYSGLCKYDFGEFTLDPNRTVKVWTKPGTDTSTELFMLPFDPPCELGLQGFWKDNQDCGYLKDQDRRTINSFCYGTQGFFAPVP
jgi:hypothetical protein